MAPARAQYEKFPNALRVLIGEEEAIAGEPAAPAIERLWMIETNMDDISPQIFGHVMERAFELGALDCYFTSVQMKKNRPGSFAVDSLSRRATRKR